MYNFEIEIKTQNAFVYSDIERIICETDCVIDEIFITDNRNYENMRSASSNDLQEFEKHISDGNIFLIYATRKDNRKCGILVYCNEGQNQCSLWFNCDNASGMDSAGINDKNEKIYVKAIEFVYKTFMRNSISYAAFGCEMYISDNAGIEKNIGCGGANAWLLPTNMLSNIPVKHTVMQLDESYSAILIKEAL